MMVVLIVRLWLNERVERIHNLTVAHNDNANGANGRALVVSCLKIYSCKISHTVAEVLKNVFG
jgi:hypothetical protein